MTTETITSTGLVLAYGPRDTAQPCRTCATTIPASSTPDFGYETEDDTAQPVCDTCLRRLDPAGHSALQVLRVVAEAATKATRDGAADFLFAIGQGVELLTEDLEDIRS